MSKKTVVLGASHKPHRYSNMAVNSLRQHDIEAVAVGRRARQVGDWEILEGKPAVEDVDTVTLYLNSYNQKEFYDYILDLEPRRVIFNPGAENVEFETLLEEKGVEVDRACTLVMLRSSQY